MGVRFPDWNECQPAGSSAGANIPSFLKDNSVTLAPALPMVSWQEPGLQLPLGYCKLWHLLSSPEDLSGDDEAGPSAEQKRGVTTGPGWPLRSSLGLHRGVLQLCPLGAWREMGVSEL